MRTNFLDLVSPHLIDWMREQMPANATELMVGTTGSGRSPNFQYRLPDATIVRRSSRRGAFLGFGSFNRANLLVV